MPAATDQYDRARRKRLTCARAATDVAPRTRARTYTMLPYVRAVPAAVVAHPGSGDRLAAWRDFP